MKKIPLALPVCLIGLTLGYSCMEPKSTLRVSNETVKFLDYQTTAPGIIGWTYSKSVNDLHVTVFINKPKGCACHSHDAQHEDNLNYLKTELAPKIISLLERDNSGKGTFYVSFVVN